ncbi:MAG: ATP cone domain-containing protein [Patescibacteria group bacterium]
MSKITKIQKRDGKIEKFDSKKIQGAIEKAFLATKTPNGKIIKRVTAQVIRDLEKKFPKKIPHVENVQDVVEKTLVKNNFSQVAKAYILYRYKRSEERETKKFLV